MGEAIRHLAGQQRDKLVVVLQSYSRFGLRLEPNIESGLRRLKPDYADILLLGLHNSMPRAAVMEAAWRKAKMALTEQSSPNNASAVAADGGRMPQKDCNTGNLV
jgi:diketogulonate reductase-like aldo/keto reductase